MLSKLAPTEAGSSFVYEAKQRQRKMETAMRAQREKVRALEKGKGCNKQQKTKCIIPSRDDKKRINGCETV